MKEKLVIIDGNSLFYRSFYALPLLKNSVGEYSNAVYGFAIAVVKIINDLKPDYFVVAFDVTKKTFRHDIYKDYKGTRKPMPEELACQLEPLKKLLDAMGIKICQKPGIEGDDIIGTLSKRFYNTDVIIVTGDRDCFQLIDDHTKVYFTKKGTSDLYIVDSDTLLRDFGITEGQVVDLKALMGDASDNIPGVAGIGPKTAKQLLKDYGNLHAIYNNIDLINGSVKQKLIDQKENAFLSFKLAEIKTDVDIECELSDCKYNYPFSKEVYDIFEHYEFKSLIKRNDIFADEITTAEVARFDQEYIQSLGQLNEVIGKLGASSAFAFYNGDQFLSVSTDNKDYKIDLTSGENTAMMPQIWQKLKPIFEGNATKVMYDTKQARHFLAQHDILIADPVFDISIAKHLAEGISVKGIADIFEDNAQQQTPASLLLHLYNEYKLQLVNLGMDNLYYNVELPLAKVLYSMEVEGFKVDTDILESLAQKYKNELEQLEDIIYMHAGGKFNINSPKQLAEVLYVKLNLPHNKKMSTAAENLEAIVDKHPIVEVILRYRKVAKIYSTYIEGLRPHIDKDGLVHTSFNQTLTTTGRLSSVEPNLQNIPARGAENKEIRSMFVARTSDNVLVDADYSQIELRLLAHFSEDEYFVEAFKKGEDIHARTASMIFNVEPSLVTPEMRRIAKVMNFGMVYGISDFGLASDLKVSPKQARQYIDNFYAAHPKVREFLDGAVQVAKATGRVSTLLGRSRKMVDITSSNYMVRSRAERASQNMPLQGSAADIVKIAMVKVAQSLQDNGLKAKLILQVHDELIVDCPKQEQQQVEQIVKKSMEGAYKLLVPLTVDVKSSYRWSDGH